MADKTEFKCGHKGTIVMYNNYKTRLKMKAYMKEKVVCRDCYESKLNGEPVRAKVFVLASKVDNGGNPYIYIGLYGDTSVLKAGELKSKGFQWSLEAHSMSVPLQIGYEYAIKETAMESDTQHWRKLEQLSYFNVNEIRTLLNNLGIFDIQWNGIDRMSSEALEKLCRQMTVHGRCSCIYDNMVRISLRKKLNEYAVQLQKAKAEEKGVRIEDLTPEELDAINEQVAEDKSGVLAPLEEVINASYEVLKNKLAFEEIYIGMGEVKLKKLIAGCTLCSICCDVIREMYINKPMFCRIFFDVVSAARLKVDEDLIINREGVCV